MKKIILSNYSHLYHIAFEFTTIVHANKGVRSSYGQIFWKNRIHRKTFGLEDSDGLSMKIHQDAWFIGRCSDVSFPEKRG